MSYVSLKFRRKEELNETLAVDPHTVIFFALPVQTVSPNMQGQLKPR